MSKGYDHNAELLRMRGEDFLKWIFCSGPLDEPRPIINFIKTDFMEHFIGTKELLAKPMTLGEYNTYREWPLPVNENPDAPGYLVEYTDSGKPNHPQHANYISWSPKIVFEKSYKKNGEMSFGHALIAAKRGMVIFRTGWNGKNMFAYIVRMESTLFRDHWELKCADGTLAKWAPSGSDSLAEDWCIGKMQEL